MTVAVMSEGKFRRAEAAADATASRRCIVTRQSLPRQQMIRFVVDPGGVLTPDLSANLPGRGLWLTARRDMFEAARDKRAFGRAARRSVSLPEALGDRLEALLAERCIGLLGLANRAGQLVAGFSQTRDWLRSGKAAILLIASGGLGRDAKELERMGRDIRQIRALTAPEMGRAIGRERIVHMALAPGRLADRLEGEAARLAGFRTV
ncbi:MAG: RNA-binding protein [Alphaproteobacteria bacterium]